MVGLGGREKLDQLVGRGPRFRAEPQRRTTASAVECADLTVEGHNGRRPRERWCRQWRGSRNDGERTTAQNQFQHH
jgi:hypothetical protein